MWSEQRREQERRSPTQERPAAAPSDLERGDGREAQRAAPAAARLTGGRGPDSQAIGVDVLVHRLGEPPQLLAEVETVAQLGDRLLALADGRDLGGGEQPAREAVLAGRRARGAQQLEQRAGSEQIEIDRVGMVLVEEARAGRSGRRPIDPRCAPGRPRSSGRRAWRARRARAPGDERPPAPGTRPTAAPPTTARRARLDREPGRDHQDQHHGEARVARPTRSMRPQRCASPRRWSRRRPYSAAPDRLDGRVGATVQSGGLPPRDSAPRRRRGPAEDVVAVREAAEALDDLAVEARPVQRVLGEPGPVRARRRSTRRREELDRAALEREVFGVLERQVEKRALGREAACRSSPASMSRGRHRQRTCVVCERRSLATLEVARELIEEDDDGERAARARRSSVELAARSRGDQASSKRRRISASIAGSAANHERLLRLDRDGIRRIRAEPEGEDGLPVAARSGSSDRSAGLMYSAGRGAG